MASREFPAQNKDMIAAVGRSGCTLQAEGKSPQNPAHLRSVCKQFGLLCEEPLQIGHQGKSTCEATAQSSTFGQANPIVTDNTKIAKASVLALSTT